MQDKRLFCYSKSEPVTDIMSFLNPTVAQFMPYQQKHILYMYLTLFNSLQLRLSILNSSIS